MLFASLDSHVDKVAFAQDLAARRVIDALRAFLGRFDEIICSLEGGGPLSPGARAHLRMLVRTLKADLEKAAARGTVEEHPGSATHYEKAYFAPAVSHAASSLQISLNSHPVGWRWVAVLEESRSEIAFHLHRLEVQDPDL